MYFQSRSRSSIPQCVSLSDNTAPAQPHAIGIGCVSGLIVRWFPYSYSLLFLSKECTCLSCRFLSEDRLKSLPQTEHCIFIPWWVPLTCCLRSCGALKELPHWLHQCLLLWWIASMCIFKTLFFTIFWQLSKGHFTGYVLCLQRTWRASFKLVGNCWPQLLQIWFRCSSWCFCWSFAWIIFPHVGHRKRCSSSNSLSALTTSSFTGLACTESTDLIFCFSSEALIIFSWCEACSLAHFSSLNRFVQWRTVHPCGFSTSRDNSSWTVSMW